MSPRLLTRHLVAFDLGGVLYDIDILRCARSARETLGVAGPALEHAVFGEGLWQRLEVGRVDGDTFLRQVLTRLDVPVSTENVAKLKHAWCSIIKLRAGATSLLARVRVPCDVWSNTDPIHAGVVRETQELARHVERWALSYRLGVEKPCADFFQQALELADLPPWRAVYVDDRGENVAQARALGVDAFVATSLGMVQQGLAARGLLRP
ncbi:MAG: HAD-IA family hydrolase [Pseudomonadota bacterium]